MAELVVLFSAFMLDCLTGDPMYPCHPVRLLGKLISAGERMAFKAGLFGYAGGFLLFTGVSGLWVSAALIVYQAADTLHPFAGMLVSIYLVYSVMGLRDLFDHAAPVQKALRNKDIMAARRYVQQFVGRDADRLDAEGIARAAVESVAENFVDSFLGVVFWFVFGFLFATLIGWPPLTGALGCVIFYRAVNTLDAMVGYKNDRYMKFGFIAAKVDDVLNFIPARLSVVMILGAAFFRGYNVKKGIRIVLRDRLKHASPNSGHPESVMAGVLGIRLGGPTIYPHGCVNKPWLGDDDAKITPDHINDACRIIFSAAWIALVAALTVMAIFSFHGP